MDDTQIIQAQEKYCELIKKQAEKTIEKCLEELQPGIEKLGLLPVHCDLTIDLFSLQEKDPSKGFGSRVMISKDREIIHE